MIQKVVNEVNATLSRILDLELQLTRWETDTYPAFHLEGSQAHIESVLRIEECDLLLCVFGRRFGTETRYAQSGTESEFRRAYNSWREIGNPQIMMYFKKGPYIPEGEEAQVQWDRLQEFRRSLPAEGFYWEYGSLSELNKLFKQHLGMFLSQSPEPILYRAPLSKFSIVSGEHSQKYFDPERYEYRIRATKARRRPGSDLRLPLVDFDCRVSARKVSGSDKSWYGLYVVQGRGGDSVMYHDFFVSGKGTFTYETKRMNSTEDQQEDLNIIQRSQLGVSIRTGNSTNQLRLSRKGSILKFSVNGQNLLEVESELSRTEEVQVGIAVHAENDLAPDKHIEVAFKDWVFYEIGR